MTPRYGSAGLASATVPKAGISTVTTSACPAPYSNRLSPKVVHLTP